MERSSGSNVREQRLSVYDATHLQTTALARGGDEFADGADFYRAGLCRRDFCGDFDGFVHVGGFDEVEAGEAFFGFGERSVADCKFAVTDRYALGGPNGLKSFRREAAA